MAKYVFTMPSSEDLGLPSRLIPVAKALKSQGHDIAFINSAKGPTALLAEMGLDRIPLPAVTASRPAFDMQAGARAFDVEHLLGLLYSDPPYLKALTEAYRTVFRAFQPDVVIDSFGPFSCLAAAIENIPVVQITQGNFLADSPGFVWWAGDRPSGLPSAVDAINAVAAEHGIAPVGRAADIMNGDCTFIVGSPETDPVDSGSRAIHIGSLKAGHVETGLPHWVGGLGRGRKLIWVYTGNPRYGGGVMATPFDSEVLLQSALEVLGGADFDVVLTTGYQALPEGPSLPANIHFANFVSGPAMAARCDLMIHHGGHGSMVTGLAAGKPAVIVPTNSERESNARRLASTGACEVVLPLDSTTTEKRIDLGAFAAAVQQVLSRDEYTQAARAVGGRLLQLGGAQAVIAAIETL